MEKLLHTIWKNDNITQKKLLHVAVLLMVTYVLIFYVFISLDHYKFIKDIDKLCMIPCNKDKCKIYTHSTRGNQYYLTEGANDAYSCVFTIWELTHILFHIGIGYYLDLRYSLAIGIPFEMYEHIHYKCENYMDVTYNVIGACIGGYLRYRNDNSKLSKLYY